MPTCVTESLDRFALDCELYVGLVYLSIYLGLAGMLVLQYCSHLIRHYLHYLGSRHWNRHCSWLGFDYVIPGDTPLVAWLWHSDNPN